MPRPKIAVWTLAVALLLCLPLTPGLSWPSFLDFAKESPRPAVAQVEVEPDPAFLDALWVATSGDLLKLSLGDGALLARQPQAPATLAVAVDEDEFRVWTFGEDGDLQALGFDGTEQTSVSFPEHADDTVVHLAAGRGFAWLAFDDVVYQVDGQGEVLATIPVTRGLRAVAFDPTLPGVWIANLDELASFGLDGQPLDSLDLGNGVRIVDLAVARSSGGLWVALSDAVRRYDAALTELFEIPFAQVRAVDPDGQGGAWVGLHREVVLLGADGAVRSSVTLPVGGGSANLLTVAADPTGASAWALSGDFLFQISPGGQIVRTLRLQDFGAGTRGRDLAVYADLVAPVISFTAPADGAVLSQTRPTLDLAWSDRGIGVDPDSLAITANGAPLAVTCEATATGAVSCIPDQPLPAGPVTLSATVADFVGNRSAPATITVTIATALDLRPIADRAVVIGSSLELALEAVGGNGSYQFTVAPLPLPEGARFDAATGVFSFQPAGVGIHPLTFSVTDGAATDAESVTVTVQAPAPGTPTSIRGRVLDTNDAVLGVETPIVGARVSFLGFAAAAFTDADGSFELINVPSGDQVIDFDTGPAELAPNGAPYAGFREGIFVRPGTANVISRPFFLPRIDPASLMTVDPAATTIVHNPNLDVTLTVPPNTAKDQSGANFTGQLSLSEVPASLAPVALPEELAPALLLTAQPVGVTFSQPVRLTIPNLDGMPPGSELDLWSVDPLTGRFSIVGVGRVSADGSVTETISGGITAASWHAFMPPGSDSDGSDNNGDNQDPDRCDDCNSGSNTALLNGNLSITHDLPAYFSLNRARSLRLVYNSNTADPQPVVTSRTTIPVRAAVPPTVSAGVEIGGLQLGLQVSTNTAGLSENRDETILQAVQVDGSGLATGLYPYRLKLTSHYSSSAISTFQSGQLLINNQSRSPIGAGWSIAGLQKLHRMTNGSVVITDGKGSIARFQPLVGAVLFADDFDDENNRSGVLNYRNLANWNVAEGAVDLIGNGFFDFLPGRGLYLDLDGSMGNAATLVSKDSFSLTPGLYRLEFGLAGSQRGGSDTVIVRLGNVFQESFTFPGNAPFTTITRDILVETPATAALSFEHLGGDNIGLLLDSVSLGSLSGASFVSPPGDFTSLVTNTDGTYVRTYKDGSVHRFDAAGRLAAAVDTTGDATTYTYDAAGRLTAVTDPAGLQTVLTYSGDHLASITDPSGRATSFQHDAAGNLIRITDADGTARSFTYDGRHRLINQRSKRGFDTTYSYNFAGQNHRVVRSDGSVRTLTSKTSAGLFAAGTTGAPVVRPEAAMARYVDGRGNSVVHDTDRFGASVRTVDPEGRVTTAVRDQNGNPTRIANSNGSIQEFTYDDRGNILSLRQTGSGGAGTQEVRLTYEPSRNRVTEVRDSAGETLSIAYDAAGNPIRITDPLGGVVEATYNARGQLLTSKDPRGNVTTFTYDAQGNLRTITDARGVVSRYDRDAAGRVVAFTEAVGLPEERTRTYTYDALNRPLTVTDPEGGTTRYAYDAAGNPVEVISATGEVIRKRFDSQNRADRLEDPVRGVTELTYDASGNVVAIVDAKGARTSFEYDAKNRPVRSLDAAGGEQRFTYDPRGNLLTLRNPLGQVWDFAYDTMDRLVRQTDPLGNSKTFTYDGRNFLASTTDARGQTTTYVYDALGRTTEVRTADDTIRRTYDAAGNVTSVEDGDSRLSWTYDELNRPVRHEVVDVGFQPGVVLSSTFDALGYRTRLTDSLGGSRDYAYDRNGRMTRLTTPAGQPIDLAYDAARRLTGVALPNGLSLDYDYDAGGRLASLQYREGGGGTLAGFDYIYDALGKLITVAEGSRVREYGYDAVERLVSGGTAGLPETYEYDVLGNRISSLLSATYRYDTANRLLEDDQFLYAYDASGNLIAKTEKATSQRTDYRYDALNQLVRIDFPDGTSAAYRYDGLGRRIEKNVDGATTRYVYDGANILLEFDGSDALAARYSHGPGTDHPLSLERDGRSYYYLADHQGSIRFLTDETGAQVNRYEYDSFGRLLVRDETVPTPYAYTGREHDPESGLYFLRARYYDPQVGRFISQDPLALGGGDPNFYGYVSNDPVNRRDPNGLFFWDLVDIAFFAWSLHDFIECPSLETGLSLALDTISLLPGLPSVGWASRADDVLDVVNHADDVGDALRHADDAADALRHADDAGDAVGDTARALDDGPKAIQPYYPPDNGFLGETRREFLYQGDVIDRYGGSDASRFFSPTGTPDYARALPPGTADQPLRTFEVVKPFEVEAGTVAPWFGQPGGGTQFRTPVTLETLLNRGIIREITPP